jgi:HEPN domain-containing protein
MTPALRAHIEGWLEKAKHDVMSAQRLLEIEPRILDTACFHCQQAIEKYLKAFLAYKRVEPPRTHNIIFLLSQCADFDTVFETIDVGNINIYGVDVRYPDLAEMPELEEAQSHYNLTLHIRNLVTERIIFV